MTAEARLAFAQIIVGDPGAAEGIYTDSLLYTAEAMENYSTNTGERDQTGTMEAASLQALVEVALMNESETRVTNDKDALDYINKVGASVLNIAGGAAGDAEAPGLLVELAKSAVGEAMNFSEKDGGENQEIDGEWVASERMKGYALAVAADQDHELMSDLEKAGIARRDEAGNMYVPPDHTAWGISGSDAELANHYDDIDEIPWPDGESSTREAVEKFDNAFTTTADKWRELLVSEG